MVVGSFVLLEEKCGFSLGCCSLASANAHFRFQDVVWSSWGLCCISLLSSTIASILWHGAVLFGLSSALKFEENHTLGCDSYWPRVATEACKCSWSKLWHCKTHTTVEHNTKNATLYSNSYRVDFRGWYYFRYIISSKMRFNIISPYFSLPCWI